ncbi:MAG TPA: FAD-dependent oxidoreductase [Solirubrobacterales bacterium]|nr:FAD-dependent oxidoreductase [Solirubrobacterales bacterium]
MTIVRELSNAGPGPLAGLRVTIIGRGPLGLVTAFALAQNGATVQVLAADPLEAGVGFKNAAGLIEPVATRDNRAARWTMDTLDFLEWATPDPAWGVIARKVLFLSDDPAAVDQGWMASMGRRDATPEELRGRRAHGAWFDTYVVQPDLAAVGIRRESMNLDVPGAAKDIVLGSPVTVESVEDAALRASLHRADLFILAPGLGLASLTDIEDLPGMPAAAGISAGMGATIRIPAESFEPPLDHVLMDDDDLGYLIPQKTHVIAGGTNDIAEHDDPAVMVGLHPTLMNEWEAAVREKVDRLLPGAGDLAGEVRVGARPMRWEVLTHWTEGFSVPGMILGGAGGSGWTFSVGIAHDACRVIAARFGCTGELLALGTKVPLAAKYGGEGEAGVGSAA